IETRTEAIGTSGKEIGSSWREIAISPAEIGISWKEIGISPAEIGISPKEIATSPKQIATSWIEMATSAKESAEGVRSKPKQTTPRHEHSARRKLSSVFGFDLTPSACGPTAGGTAAVLADSDRAPVNDGCWPSLRRGCRGRFGRDRRTPTPRGRRAVSAAR